MPRIFKYPSEQHLGEMVVKSAHGVERASTQVIVIGVVLTALGILLVVYDRIIAEKETRQGLRRKQQQRRLQKLRKRSRNS